MMAVEVRTVARSSNSVSMPLQHIPRHQLEGNEFNSLRRWRCLVLAYSFKVKCLSHQFEGVARFFGPIRLGTVEFRACLEQT
jgi:hypothetical protein